MGSHQPPPTTASMAMFDLTANAGSRPTAGLVPLLVAGAAQVPSVYLLSGREATLGRDRGVEVFVDAHAVSRRHARIARDGEQWTITDLQSRNGTLVDGVFVTHAPLAHGSIVRTGDALHKFVAVGAEHFRGYRYDGTLEPGAQRAARGTTALLGGAQIDHIVAHFEKIAPTMLSVIVHGESGTGKEVVARELHRLSGRRGACVAVNCAAIPAQLLESELFGYRRGAFSGADRDKVGLVKAAHGGTLFLDEIGDMPLEAQAKLLRVLQAREVMPIGATQAEPVDVRVVCATHRDLNAQQARGAFRGDLFARLNEYAVVLPPLRERKEDLYLLTRALLARHGRPDVEPAFGFLLGLVHYNWPFNVRELEACVRRALALAEGPLLDVQHLPDALRHAIARYGRPSGSAAPGSAPPLSPSIHTPPPAPVPSGYALPPPPVPSGHALPPPPAPSGQAYPPGGGALNNAQAPTEAELRALLASYQGNVAAVGRVLGKERMQIHRWMKKYGIVVDEYRQGLPTSQPRASRLAPAPRTPRLAPRARAPRPAPLASRPASCAPRPVPRVFRPAPRELMPNLSAKRQSAAMSPYDPGHSTATDLRCTICPKSPAAPARNLLRSCSHIVGQPPNVHNADIDGSARLPVASRLKRPGAARFHAAAIEGQTEHYRKNPPSLNPSIFSQRHEHRTRIHLSPLHARPRRP
jgi:DNA-binding NtrC family response regulator